MFVSVGFAHMEIATETHNRGRLQWFLLGPAPCDARFSHTSFHDASPTVLAHSMTRYYTRFCTWLLLSRISACGMRARNLTTAHALLTTCSSHHITTSQHQQHTSTPARHHTSTTSADAAREGRAQDVTMKAVQRLAAQGEILRAFRVLQA
eukprot:3098714-Rhodomonas_salina.9